MWYANCPSSLKRQNKKQNKNKKHKFENYSTFYGAFTDAPYERM